MIRANIQGLARSATIAIAERCEAMRADGQSVFRLGLGQSPFPVPRPVIEALRANAWRKDYLPTPGLRALRDAIAEYHHRRHGVPLTGDQVLVGPGSKELMFLLQVVYDGELLVPTPAWVSYAPQARILGRRARFLHTRSRDGWRLTPDALDGACVELGKRPAILILNYPGNPTGTTYAPGDLALLANVAKRHDLVVLSDEIYGELHFEGKHVSIARYYPEGTILSTGLSKWCGAGGWRLGSFAFPRTLAPLREAMTAVASESFTSTSAPIQYAAVRAFEGGPELERYLSRARSLLSALVGTAHARLVDRGLDVARAAGGFYLFPDFAPHQKALRERGIKTGRDLCAQLLEHTGVAVLPGSDFGRAVDDLTARMALVDFDGARAMDAMEAQAIDVAPDEAFLDTYCDGVLTAVNRVCRWLA